MRDKKVQLFLTTLHSLGVPLAVLCGDGRWAGVLCDSADRYWLVEGKVVEAAEIIENGLETRDHCFSNTYELAIEAFRRWWDNDFQGVPVCSMIGADIPSIEQETR
jgi:hypothetical protein